MSSPVSDLDPVRGARNLLEGCISAKPGESLLIVCELDGTGYYEPAVADVIVQQARTMGINTSVLSARTASGPHDVPVEVVDAIRGVDHTLFLSRLGDQIRFSEDDVSSTRTVSYTRDLNCLGSAFGCTPFRLFSDVHDRLVKNILAASSYRLTCDLGSDLTGDVPEAGQTQAIFDFSVTGFPCVIYPPLTCKNVNGQLVFDRFLMSTSVNNFENSVLPLPEHVTATIEDSRIVEFNGATKVVEQVREQYRRVGTFSGGDAFALNSWHTGIYPHTFYQVSASRDIQRWAELTFASPRYTHFHTCGVSPGNIATATFDATISFDDEVFWRAGKPVFLERADMQKLLRDYPESSGAFDMCWDIGL